jgi:hypothetical protein
VNRKETTVMSHWWEIASEEPAVPRQREQVRAWADDHDVEIVREFADGESPPEDSHDE